MISDVLILNVHVFTALLFILFTLACQCEVDMLFSIIADSLFNQPHTNRVYVVPMSVQVMFCITFSITAV